MPKRGNGVLHKDGIKIGMDDARPITKEIVVALGGRPDDTTGADESCDYGLTVYGFDDQDPPADPDIHLHLLVSFDGPATVYLEEYDDAGRSSGIVELPQIKTAAQLKSLVMALKPGKV